MRLCNACRYCEGYCAVFPAMERRLVFPERDLNYLANLCHNCGECFYACPYSPPHEFKLNLPRTLAETRLATYRKYAWPAFASRLFGHSTLFSAVAALIGSVFIFFLVLSLTPLAAVFKAHPDSTGAFYAVLPHSALIPTFLLISFGVLTVLIVGYMRFWRDIGETISDLFQPHAWTGAVADSLRLRYLEGGGDGCAYPSEAPSHSRRWYHHLTFYGFMLCFASTSVAALYHYIFHWYAPYPFVSLPVILGTAGGIGLVVGPTGLLRLKLGRNKDLTDPNQTGIDLTFLALLLLTSLTGLLLLIFRETAAMTTLLCIHLGVVIALFVTIPYGKFVHATYRFGALVKNRLEKRRPSVPSLIN